jgi:hypothetical protein
MINMSDYLQIVLTACFVVAVFVLTRFMVTWRLRRAVTSILNDLEAQGAIDEGSAAALPCSKPNTLRLVIRDYHSRALQYMVSEGVVGLTPSGKYYLRIRSE